MNNMQHSKNFPDSFYRVSVKGLCIQDGKIFLMKESSEKSGKWMLPGGGLDFGESMQEALAREIEEEMSLLVTSMEKAPLYTWTSLFKNERDMDWYYSVVLVYKIELKDFNFTPSAECEEVGFFLPEELGSLDMYHQSAKLREVINAADFQ